jgi:hypothetical protein
MKKIYCTLLLLVPLFLSGNTMAQGLKFGVGGGLSVFSNGNSNLSYSAGAHVGVKIKLDIPMVPITPVGFVNYHFLSGTYDNSGISATYNQKILSYGIGAEYTLLPGLVRPYIAVDFGVNNIGEGTLSTPIGTFKTIPSETRSGLDIGAGTEIKIPFLFTLDGSIKYNMMNLFGKDSGEDNFSAVVINVSVLF